jgi:radical SAM superfamily enzyme YgiQ (UPF0313 family)
MTQISPLGLLHVVSYLENNYYPCMHVYLTREGELQLEKDGRQKEDTQSEMNAILEFIGEKKPNLIGMTLMTLSFFRAKRLTQAIKQEFPAVPVLWGGVHPTFNPEESLRYADYVCIGEGEDAVLDLVRALEKGEVRTDIPNIWMKKDGEIIKNEVRLLIENPDDYPFPQTKWSHTYCLDRGQIKPLTPKLYRKYTRYDGTMYDVITSRGCPFACSYCCNSFYRRLYTNKGRYVRHRSVDNVIEELKYVRREFPFVKIINIQDDSFGTASEEHLEEFADKYSSEIGLPFRCRLTATKISEAKIRSLVRANVMSVIIGIQANDRINKAIFNRNIPFESTLKLARLVKKYNLVGEYQLIGRNPYETEEDMVEICKMLVLLPKPYRLQIFALGLFLNTDLRKKAVADGIEVNELDGYTTRYGSYPERFPVLRSIQQIAPLTPSRLILYFLKHRKSAWAEFLLGAYKKACCDSIERLREIVIHSSPLVLMARKMLLIRNNIRRLRAK